MWGRAGQIVLCVIALVLHYPARAMLAGPVSSGSFVAEGRAFAGFPKSEPVIEDHRPVVRPTLHSYVRRVSHDYAAPAKRTALIVGINNARGTSPLPGSLTDAHNMKEALTSYGFEERNVTVLLEGQATREAILAGLRSLAARTPPDGVAVFAIATHTNRAGGRNLLATAEGGRISAAELAAHLREVRAPAWIALPTCYAGGYALPGIVGFNRVATFASSANRMSYQAGDAGSFLFIHMVRRAMVEGHAPASVESAFGFAYRELSRDHPEHVPSMSDGYPGELVLGPAPTRDVSWEAISEPTEAGPAPRPWEYRTYGSPSRSQPSPTPEPTKRPRRGPVGVCGSVRYNCR